MLRKSGVEKMITDELDFEDIGFPDFSFLLEDE
jgi:hypothetical protein